tara:strand:+ start:10131 stop:10484 length:354 start_codon:yes stop_codon:yes gene_type:complete
MNKAIPRKISPKELHQWMNEESNKPFLIDVREDQELMIASFPSQVLHLPLSRFSFWSENLSKLVPLDQSVVVLCHAGIRSLNFGIWLLEQNLGYQVWNLDGGIDAWSLDVDSDVPRY